MKQEDKKLIAEFMDCLSEDLFYHKNDCNPTSWNEVNYDSDWNMLIPVYLKAKKTIKSKVIYGMIHNTGYLCVHEAGEFILKDDIVGASNNQPIKAILWYNKNCKNE